MVARTVARSSHLMAGKFGAPDSQLVIGTVGPHLTAVSRCRISLDAASTVACLLADELQARAKGLAARHRLKANGSGSEEDAQGAISSDGFVSWLP